VLICIRFPSKISVSSNWLINTPHISRGIKYEWLSFLYLFSICFEDRIFELKEKKGSIHVNIMQIIVILN